LYTLVLLWRPVVPKSLSPKLFIKFVGPFRVIEKLSGTNYKIRDLRSNVEQNVHVKRLRAFTPVELERYDSLEFEQGKEIDLSRDPMAKDHNLQETELEP